MIPQDAIVILNDIQNTLEETSFLKRCAIDMAIEALKERPHGEWIKFENRVTELEKTVTNIQSIVLDLLKEGEKK